MQVDHEWCLACDKRNPNTSSLYCSEDCRAVDLMRPLRPAVARSPTTAPSDATRRPSTSHSTHHLNRKLLGIYEWRSQVEPGLDESDDACPKSPLEFPDPLLSSPRYPRFPLSASCVDPPRLIRLPPVPDDMESLCPPTLALTAEEESLVVTPPTQSVAATPAVGLAHDELSPALFDHFARRLRSWRARTADDLCVPDHAAAIHASADELLPVGVEAATFYWAHNERPRPRSSDSGSHWSSSSPAMPIPRGRLAADRRLH